jgi:hypothetical protein
MEFAVYLKTIKPISNEMPVFLPLPGAAHHSASNRS